MQLEFVKLLKRLIRLIASALAVKFNIEVMMKIKPNPRGSTFLDRNNSQFKPPYQLLTLSIALSDSSTLSKSVFIVLNDSSGKVSFHLWSFIIRALTFKS